MPTRGCDACGTTEGVMTEAGRASFCDRCYTIAAEERDRLFQADKPVNMMEIAMKMARTHHKWPDPITSTK